VIKVSYNVRSHLPAPQKVGKGTTETTSLETLYRAGLNSQSAIDFFHGIFLIPMIDCQTAISSEPQVGGQNVMLSLQFKNGEARPPVFLMIATPLLTNEYATKLNRTKVRGRTNEVSNKRRNWV